MCTLAIFVGQLPGLPLVIAANRDEFLDRKLVLAEIELISARDDVAIPDWLARCLVREVTGEIEYLNHTLAR